MRTEEVIIKELLFRVLKNMPKHNKWGTEYIKYSDAVDAINFVTPLLVVALQNRDLL